MIIQSGGAQFETHPTAKTKGSRQTPSRCSGDQVSFHPFKSIDSLLLASVVKQVFQVITKVGQPEDCVLFADQVVWHTLKGLYNLLRKTSN